MLRVRLRPRGRRIVVSAAAALAAFLVPSLVLGCFDREDARKVSQALQTGAQQPDEVPVMLNAELPFRYPAALYEQRVQGNVTLRLYVDRDGNVAPDSTRVEESSGYTSLDSAAVKGSQELRFVPAKAHGEPVPLSILFPVYFRHPEAPALPGDTILAAGRTAGTAAPQRRDSVKP